MTAVATAVSGNINGDAFAGGDKLLERGAFLVALARALKILKLAFHQIDAKVGLHDLNPADCRLDTENKTEFCQAVVYLDADERNFLFGEIVKMALHPSQATAHLNTDFFVVSDTLKKDPNSQRDLDAYSPLTWGKTFTVIYPRVGDRDFVANDGLLSVLGHEIGHPWFHALCEDKIEIEQGRKDADEGKVGPKKSKQKKILDALGELLRAYGRKYVRINEEIAWSPLVHEQKALTSVVDSAGQPLFFKTIGNTPHVGKLQDGNIRFKRMHGFLKSEAAPARQNNGDIVLFGRGANDELLSTIYQTSDASWRPWVKTGDNKVSAAVSVVKADEKTNGFLVAGISTEQKLSTFSFSRYGANPEVKNENIKLKSIPVAQFLKDHRRFLFGGAFGHVYDGTQMVETKNPLTNTMNCPTGYFYQMISGYAGYDWSAWVCLKVATSENEVPVAYFGGFVGSVQGANHYNHAMKIESCPTGYEQHMILYLPGGDYKLFYCYRRPASDVSEVFALRGLYFWEINSPASGSFIRSNDSINSSAPYNSTYVETNLAHGTTSFDNFIYTYGGGHYWNQLALPTETGSGDPQMKVSRKGSHQISFSEVQSTAVSSTRSPAFATSGMQSYLVSTDGDGKMFLAAGTPESNSTAYSAMSEITIGFKATSRPTAYLDASQKLHVWVYSPNGLKHGTLWNNTWTWENVAESIDIN